MNKSNRRTFVKTTGAITALSAFGVHSSAAAKEETVNLGIIGCGGIMGMHVNGLVQRKENVSFAWLCDVDPKQIEQKAKSIHGFQSTAPNKTSEFEDVISDQNVDAVIIATPHHWHAPIAIPAMAEGKDTYIEKPISHVYNEGHAIIQAAQKYNRIV